MSAAATGAKSTPYSGGSARGASPYADAVCQRPTPGKPPRPSTANQKLPPLWVAASGNPMPDGSVTYVRAVVQRSETITITFPTGRDALKGSETHVITTASKTRECVVALSNGALLIPATGERRSAAMAIKLVPPAQKPKAGTETSALFDGLIAVGQASAIARQALERMKKQDGIGANKRPHHSPPTAMRIEEEERLRKDQIVNDYLKAILLNDELLLEFCNLLPKIEHHNHLGGSIPPVYYLQFAAERGFYVNPIERKFYEKAGDGRVKVMDFICRKEHKAALDDLVESMSALQDNPASFFKSFAPGDSLTDSGLMRLEFMLKWPLLEAVRQNTLHTEYMKGVRTEAASKELADALEAPDQMPPVVADTLTALNLTGWMDADDLKAISLSYKYSKAFGIVRKSKVIEKQTAIFAEMVQGAMEMTRKEIEGRVQIPGGDQIHVPSYILIGQVDRLREDVDFFNDTAVAMHLPLGIDKFRGVTIANEEASLFAITHFAKQMEMLSFFYFMVNDKLDKLGQGPLTAKDKRVKVTLHAGEFTEAMILEKGLVPSQVSDHVLAAAEFDGIGHATRMTLAALAKVIAENRRVELCPTSSYKILGIPIDKHPALKWIEKGVDVSVSTDDACVGRTTLAMEWMRVIRAAKLSWEQIRSLIRGSAEQAFLHGESIYRKIGKAYVVQTDFADCAKPVTNVPPLIQARIAASEKGRLQLELERSFLFFVDKIQAMVDSDSLT